MQSRVFVNFSHSPYTTGMRFFNQLLQRCTLKLMTKKDFFFSLSLFSFFTLIRRFVGSFVYANYVIAYNTSTIRSECIFKCCWCNNFFYSQFYDNLRTRSVVCPLCTTYATYESIHTSLSRVLFPKSQMTRFQSAFKLSPRSSKITAKCFGFRRIINSNIRLA